jgi:hypothetical protein
MFLVPEVVSVFLAESVDEQARFLSRLFPGSIEKKNGGTLLILVEYHS